MAIPASGCATRSQRGIRVERSLAAGLPDHVDEQRSYLERQVQDLVPTVLPEMRQVCPERLYTASTAMNMVLAEEAAEITGAPVPHALRPPCLRAVADRLQHTLNAFPDDYAGDRKVVDAWAQELGMNQWYVWVRL